MDPVAHVVLRAALALLFLAAALHKVRDPGRFRVTLAEYRLLPRALVAAAAAALVAAEAGVAVALALPGRSLPGALGAAGLLAVYGLAVAVNLARGRRDLDCGCAGPALRRPISGGLVVRNAVLAAAALATLAPVGPRPLVWLDAVTVLGATGALAALWAAAERLLAHAPVLARVRGNE